MRRRRTLLIHTLGRLLWERGPPLQPRGHQICSALEFFDNERRCVQQRYDARIVPEGVYYTYISRRCMVGLRNVGFRIANFDNVE